MSFLRVSLFTLRAQYLLIESEFCKPTQSYEVAFFYDTTVQKNKNEA